jgi:hypothetical protein
MDTKTCTKCGEEKSVEEFRFSNKAANKRASWCKPCFAAHEKRAYESPERKKAILESNQTRSVRNRRFLWDFLSSHPCKVCGEPDPVVLEFNHLDPTKKTMAVTDMASGSYGVTRLKEEIEKCEVMCSNCHRRHTAQQGGWYQYL